MYDTDKFIAGSPEVYEQIMMLYFPDDDKNIEPGDLIHEEERRQLRFGGEDDR